MTELTHELPSHPNEPLAAVPADGGAGRSSRKWIRSVVWAGSAIPVRFVVLVDV